MSRTMAMPALAALLVGVAAGGYLDPQRYLNTVVIFKSKDGWAFRIAVGRGIHIGQQCTSNEDCAEHWSPTELVGHSTRTFDPWHGQLFVGGHGRYENCLSWCQVSVDDTLTHLEGTHEKVERDGVCNHLFTVKGNLKFFSDLEAAGKAQNPRMPRLRWLPSPSPPPLVERHPFADIKVFIPNQHNRCLMILPRGIIAAGPVGKSCDECKMNLDDITVVGHSTGKKSKYFGELFTRGEGEYEGYDTWLMLVEDDEIGTSLQVVENSAGSTIYIELRGRKKYLKDLMPFKGPLDMDHYRETCLIWRSRSGWCLMAQPGHMLAIGEKRATDADCNKNFVQTSVIGYFNGEYVEGQGQMYQGGTGRHKNCKASFEMMADPDCTDLEGEHTEEWHKGGGCTIKVVARWTKEAFNAKEREGLQLGKKFEAAAEVTDMDGGATALGGAAKLETISGLAAVAAVVAGAAALWRRAGRGSVDGASDGAFGVPDIEVE